MLRPNGTCIWGTAFGGGVMGSGPRVWRVKTTVVITLPWWIPGKPVPRELVESWNKCVIGLICHEQGHVVLGEAAGAEVKQRALGLPAFGSAQEVADAATQALNETIEKFHEREIKCDEVTRHGFTQGAVFRMTPGEAGLEDRGPGRP